MKKITFFIFIMIVNLSAIWAQLPHNFKYQAVVRDNDGGIVQNKKISLELSIRKGGSQEPKIFSEVFDYTTNEYGIISVVVGNGENTLGNFSTIDWGADIYYLEVAIDLNNGSNFVFMGVSQILAVPYSLYAIDVKNNDDADADPTNEIQDLQLVNNVLKITNNSTATEIPLSQYIGVDTDEQTLSRNIIGNTVEISIIRGNSINFDLPSDFVSKANGGTFAGPIHATNFSGTGTLALLQNLTVSGIGSVIFNSQGPTNLNLPLSGTLATESFVSQSIISSNALPTGNIWIGIGNVATAFPASGTGQVLIGNGTGLGSYPISGDATLSSTGILTLSPTGITPGTYFSTTVDSKGRVTFGSNPSTLAGFGITDALSKNLNSGNIIIGNASNQAAEVTMGGDATISSTGILSLANSGVVPNTYKSVTVDSKGRVTNGTNPTTLAGYGITDGLSVNLNNGNFFIGNSLNIASQVIMQGDASLSNTGFLTLANTSVVPGTYRSLTVDSKGRVTNGTNPTTLSGYGITDALSVNLPNGNFLIGNISGLASQVSMSGDATLSNTGALTLSSSGVSSGTYRSVTVDSKGRVTAGTNPTTIAGYGITDALSTNLATSNILVGNISGFASQVSLSGDATLNSSGALTLSSSGVTSGTYRSVTVDSKGRVTAGSNPTTLSGYGITDAVSVNLTNGNIYIGNGSGIATQVTVSGDATLSNAGVLTLSNTGVTIGTYRSVTVDSKGRVTAGTNPTTLAGYGITDAMNISHPANGITGTDVTNWNTAFGWGDHAAEGYLKSYTETDPNFAASPANGISAANITNWNTAFGWGDHSGLYKLITYVPTWSEITSKPTTISGYGITDGLSTSLANGNILVGNGSGIASQVTVSGDGTLSNAGVLSINWSSPGTIGSGTPNSANFTTVNISDVLHLTPMNQPSTSVDGDIYLDISDNTLYCKINGSWVPLN
ncbi:MAG: hypothetical protein U0W24_24440 [Bacteroidales bacterium]